MFQHFTQNVLIFSSVTEANASSITKKRSAPPSNNLVSPLEAHNLTKAANLRIFIINFQTNYTPRESVGTPFKPAIIPSPATRSPEKRAAR